MPTRKLSDVTAKGPDGQTFVIEREEEIMHGASGIGDDTPGVHIEYHYRIKGGDTIAVINQDTYRMVGGTILKRVK